MGDDGDRLVFGHECDWMVEGNGMDMNQLREDIIARIRRVYDPEISTNVYDLGLIYEIDLAELPHCKIKMTLTSAWCPSAAELPIEVEQAATSVDGIDSCKVEIVWMPPWGPHMMSEAAQLELNMFADNDMPWMRDG